MNTTAISKPVLGIAIVLGLGALLAWAIVHSTRASSADPHEEPAHASHAHGDQAGEQATATGPEGGRLLRDGDYALEVTLFESGVAPEFRLYSYRQGKPLPPTQIEVHLTLERLGRAPQTIAFTPVAGYLRGQAEVVEPHSFKVTIDATEGGRTHRFSYEQEEARVHMDDTQLAEAGITLAVAGPARISSSLELLGEVRYNADRTVQVVPRVDGLVEQVLVSAGQAVKKGQVLAVLSSPVLADQRAEALAAHQRVALARATHEREKKLWEERITAKQDYLRAQAALQEAEIMAQSLQQKLAHLGTTDLRAPIGGVVTDKRISAGETISGSTQVFTVSDLSSVWVEAPVAAKDLQHVQPGQTAMVSAGAFDAQAKGEVVFVSALLGEQTRAATARILLPNPDGRWRPGLPVKVRVTSGSVDVPVAVRVEALQNLRDWQVVFGRYGELLEARPLQLGRSDGHMVEVRQGLAAGERYATNNSFVIKAELGKSGASHEH